MSMEYTQNCEQFESLWALPPQPTLANTPQPHKLRRFCCPRPRAAPPDCRRFDRVPAGLRLVPHDDALDQPVKLVRGTLHDLVLVERHHQVVDMRAVTGRRARVRVPTEGGRMAEAQLRRRCDPRPRRSRRADLPYPRDHHAARVKESSAVVGSGCSSRQSIRSSATTRRRRTMWAGSSRPSACAAATEVLRRVGRRATPVCRPLIGASTFRRRAGARMRRCG